MMASHKDKERLLQKIVLADCGLRHRKQVKLLNEVMEQVPNLPQKPNTKTKKLRNLVLYSHFLKMVHSKLIKECGSIPHGDKSSVVPKPSKVVSKPKMGHFYERKKPKRAHIVFLQADKSANQTDQVLEKPVLYDNCEESASVKDYEYKLPDVISFDNERNDRNNQFDEDVMLPVNSNHTAVPIFDNRKASTQTSFVNGFEEESYNFERDLSKDQFFDEKENVSPVDTSSSTMNRSLNDYEDFLFDNVEHVSQNIVDNRGNLMPSAHKENKFHAILRKPHNNYILQDIQSSNNVNQKFQVSETNTLNQNRDYFISSYYPYSYQNFPNCYLNNESRYDNSFLNLSGKYFYQPPVLLNSSICPTDFFLSSAVPIETPLYSSCPLGSSQIGNIPNNRNSGSSADKVSIDVENLSDSNPSCSNFSDSSNSLHFNTNCSESPFQSIYDNMKVASGQTSAADMTIKQELVESDCNVPLLPPLYNSFDSDYTNSDIAFIPMHDISQPSYFGNICSNSVDLRNNSAVFLRSESCCSSPIEESHNNIRDEPRSLYSPQCRNSLSKNMPLLETEFDSLSSNSFLRSSQESSVPMFFEEEVSIPLAQYYENY